MSKMEKYASKYGRHDLDRLGLFIEMPYFCSGQKKKKKQKTVKKIPVITGSMLPGTNLIKCGNQDGYFDEEFKRLKPKCPKAKKKSKKSKPPGLVFLPANPGKKHSTPNDYFGCFYEESPERFSPLVRGRSQYPREKKPLILERPNPLTSPAKKGGPGYADTALDFYPEHSAGYFGPKPLKKQKKGIPGPPPMYRGFCPKMYFTPNPYFETNLGKKPLYMKPKEKVAKKKKGKKKVSYVNPKFMPGGPGPKPGGCHAGCFTPWPQHTKETYLTPEQIQNYVQPVKKGAEPPKKIIEPVIPPNLIVKSFQMRSLFYNIQFAVTPDNYKNYQPTYVKNL